MSRHVPTPDRPRDDGTAALAALTSAVRELSDDELATAVVACALARDGLTADGNRRVGDVIGAATAMFAAEQVRRRRLVREAERDLMSERVETWWGPPGELP